MNILYTAIAITVIAVLGALFFANRGNNSEQKSVKILVFGVYFWVLVFIQLIIFGIAYRYLK